MKFLYLIFGVLAFVRYSDSQYSYVYEIRHDPKQPPKSESFGDLSQDKHNGIQELAKEAQMSSPPRVYSDGIGRQSEYQSSATPPKTIRDFSVRSPEMGPTILNLIRRQMNDKPTEPSDQVWQISPDSRGNKNALLYQSDTKASVYSPQQFHIDPNQLPLYSEKNQPILQKGYPALEQSRPQPTREEQQRSYERVPSYPLSYPSPPPPPPGQSPQKDERQTVHQIQTPNYRIQLLSEPESLEKLLPFLRLDKSQQISQTYPQPQSLPMYTSQPLPSPPPQAQPLHRQQPQPYVLSIDRPQQRLEPLRHTFSQGRPEESAHQLPPQPTPQSYDASLQPLLSYPPQPLPQPILELPKQQLPPQLAHLSRPVYQQQPPPHPYSQPLRQSPPPPVRQPELGPHAQALYQIASPNLTPKSGPQPQDIPQYSRVDYTDDREQREGGRPRSPYLDDFNANPLYRHSIEESAQKRVVPFVEQIEKLEQNPLAQNRLFDSLKSKSIELSSRGESSYPKTEREPQIESDPNYKSPPIPDEYKPYRQTRYYKTYV